MIGASIVPLVSTRIKTDFAILRIIGPYLIAAALLFFAYIVWENRKK